MVVEKRKINKVNVTMLQYQMLTAEQIRNFFVKHHIPLEGEVNLSERILDVAEDAYEFGGKIFALFFDKCINNENNIVITQFNSYEELAECYSLFLIGYNKINTPIS